MTNGKNKRNFDVDEIKRAAEGRWADIIPALTGISRDTLNGKEHPCPKSGCGGTDRFAAFPDFSKLGGVRCRHCHNGASKPKSGDGIAAVQWLTGCTFPQALRMIAAYIGIAPVDPAEDTRDMIGDLCKQKKMPLKSALAYGAEVKVRGNQRVVRFPIYDSEGNATSYSDVSPYSNGKLNKGMIGKGCSAGLHLPDGRVPKRGETWLICEGVKDASALHGLGFSAAGLTGCNLKSEFASMFSGCVVVLVPDLDYASIRGFSKIGTEFESIAASVLIARLPGELKPSKGDDVRDIIGQDGAEAIRKAIETAERFDLIALQGSRPTVYVTLDDDAEIDVANKVIRILASRGFSTDDSENRIFQRGGKLVAVANMDTGPGIVLVDEIGIRERITAAMDLVESRKDAKGNETEKLVRPPGWLCKAIHARPVYDHVRRLDRIVTAPTMRADGSILQTAGYDPDSRLLYVPNRDFPPIPNKPTNDEAKRAAAELLDIVVDFPFDGDVAKSVWLAAVLTLLGRSAIVGNIPLFAFTANIRGSGKSKLCDLAGLIAFGRTMARKSLPGDDDETRKVITAIAIEARPAVLLDNATGMIGNASLDAVLTSESWNDRILGKSETTGDLPWRTVLMATGNNLAFRDDTARRVTLCRLDCRDETPEDRNNFQHENIDAYTLENRHRLAVAALTILRSFVVAGRPYKGKRLGSFESWSDLICGALVFAGLPNPIDTVSIVREQDNTGAIVRLLLDGIAEVGGADGLSSREILDGITTDPTDKNLKWDPLRAAFSEITDKPTTRRIGNELKKYLHRVSGGRRLVKKPGRSNVVRWAVETLDTLTTVPDVTAPSELDDLGRCDQCGEPIIGFPTADGYLNRHCEHCNRDFSCIKNPEGLCEEQTRQSAFI